MILLGVVLWTSAIDHWLSGTKIYIINASVKWDGVGPRFWALVRPPQRAGRHLRPRRCLFGSDNKSIDFQASFVIRAVPIFRKHPRKWRVTVADRMHEFDRLWITTGRRA